MTDKGTILNQVVKFLGVNQRKTKGLSFPLCVRTINLFQSFSAVLQTFQKVVGLYELRSQTNHNATGTGPFPVDHYLATRDCTVSLFCLKEA